MDEFTSQIEELNSKLTMKKVSASQQNLAFQAEANNGSAPTFFIPGIGNGSLTGTMMHKSSSSSQLAKELPLMEEVWYHACHLYYLIFSAYHLSVWIPISLYIWKG